MHRLQTNIHLHLGFDDFLQQFQMSTSNVLRREVLSCYKALLKTRKVVFKDDDYALAFSLSKIREEFRKNISEKDEDQIKNLIKIGEDAEKILRTSIIQARLNERGNYVIQTRSEVLEDSPIIKEGKCDGHHYNIKDSKTE